MYLKSALKGVKNGKGFSGVYEAVLAHNAKSAVQFLSEKLVIRATRRLYGKKIRKGPIEVLISLGKPNYQERNFIKRQKSKKQSIGGIWLRLPPVSKK